jgi:glycyl-tRNA synthetase
MPDPGSCTQLQAAADFVLEIGTEELPPAEASSAVEQLRSRLPQLLEDLALVHGGVAVHGTPRRIVAIVRMLEPLQASTTEERRGPPRLRAYDEAGMPTKALLGFCKSNGADIDAVYFQADKKVCPDSSQVVLLCCQCGAGC